MKLSFYAREDALVREAGIHPQIGQASRYYGRSFDADTRGYPASRDAFVCEQGSEDAEKCAKQCRKGALWAADAATASAIGVAFVDLEFNAGAWSAKPKQAAKASKEAS